ncbi:uncharacterized protein LOC128861550 isoform X2 [Anastrepha ludens]|uniref:uncharacterized protein LOC128861550 isoform X2 n=1 Tax=Anastrepha ludens TaxID=28586 RepID=UPI0023AF2E52|nr:uncharacterized protein LOC128861550 isoform X2 [Anastrepha ludens]
MLKRHKILQIFVLLMGIGHLAGQGCNVCQSNTAACINETSFHLCYGGTVPITEQTFHCDDGLVCSDQPNICFQSGGATASCGDTSSCGLCNENNVFACTSRNTFAFCFGATQPTNVNGTCPTGRVCDASTQDICVLQAQNTSIICNLDQPVATTALDETLAH